MCVLCKKSDERIAANLTPEQVLENQIRSCQADAGDGQAASAWDYGYPQQMQQLLDDGSVWRLEGSAGRAAMEAITSGACFLANVPSRDYYGNRIPARGELKEGSKGTLQNCARFYGLD